MGFFRLEQVDFLAPQVTTNDYGDREEDWSEPVVTGSDAALVEPISSDEPSSLDRKAVTIGYLLKFDHEIHVGRLDRVRVRGRVCSVEGEPAVWRSGITDRVDTLVQTRFVNG